MSIQNSTNPSEYPLITNPSTLTTSPSPESSNTQKKPIILPPITPSYKIIEESPIFTNDNERELFAYRNYIKLKLSLIDRNAQNYLSFLSNRNSALKTPANIETNLDKSFSYARNSYNLSNESDNHNKSIDFVPQRIKSKLSDITNPGYFAYNSYSSLQKKKKEYLKYNYYNMEKQFTNRRELNKDELLEINPYNEKHSKEFNLGETTLKHNTILNPVPNFEYNRYLNRKYMNQ